jgi:hypothetical protein
MRLPLPRAAAKVTRAGSGKLVLRAGGLGGGS